MEPCPQAPRLASIQHTRRYAEGGPELRDNAAMSAVVLLLLPLLMYLWAFDRERREPPPPDAQPPWAEADHHDHGTDPDHGHGADPNPMARSAHRRQPGGGGSLDGAGAAAADETHRVDGIVAAVAPFDGIAIEEEAACGDASSPRDPSSGSSPGVSTKAAAASLAARTAAFAQSALLIVSLQLLLMGSCWTSASSVRQWAPCAWLPFDDYLDDSGVASDGGGSGGGGATALTAAANGGGGATTTASADVAAAQLHHCALAFDGHSGGRRVALLEILLPAVLPSAVVVCGAPVAFCFFCRWLSTRSGAPLRKGYTSESFLSAPP